MHDRHPLRMGKSRAQQIAEQMREDRKQARREDAVRNRREQERRRER